jgi:hypothetical protein
MPDAMLHGIGRRTKIGSLISVFGDYAAED